MHPGCFLYIALEDCSETDQLCNQLTRHDPTMQSPPPQDEIDPYHGAHTRDKYWDSELDLKVSFLFHEYFMVRSGFRGEAHKDSRVILSH